MKDDKITPKELTQVLQSWNRIKRKRHLKDKAIEAIAIDNGLTEDEARIKRNQAQAKWRSKQMNADRRNFADWLKAAHNMSVEDVARMYDKQNRTCRCSRPIRLAMDYRILKDSLACLSCYSNI